MFNLSFHVWGGIFSSFFLVALHARRLISESLNSQLCMDALVMCESRSV